MKFPRLFPAKRKSPPRALAWTLLSLGIIFLLPTLFFLSSMRPSFGTGTYAFENESPVTFDPPLYFESKAGLLTVTLPMELGSVHSRWYVITPDDCLETLFINGENVSFEMPLCLDQRGVALNLGDYLHEGTNEISFGVRDHGGFGGISIAPWMGDSLVLIHLVLITLSLIAICVAILLLLRASRTVFLLFAILFVGLVIRLALSQTDGHGFDVSTNQGWAKSATLIGLSDSYEKQVDGTMLPNYAPFSMILFAVTGHFYKFFISTGFDRLDPLFRTVIKFPAILSDIITAGLLFVILRKKKHEKAGLIAALVYCLHPAVIFNSAVWGQIDSVYTLFIIGALTAALLNLPFLFGVLGMLSVLTKLQAIILFPAAALLAFRSFRTFLLTGLGMLLTVILVVLPFLLGGAFENVIESYTESVGYYPSLAFGAYNLWQALFGDGTGASDQDLFLHFLKYRTVGLILFAATPIILVARRWREHLKLPTHFPQSLTPFFVTAMTAFAFFLFNTEMHERYLFPLMALGIPFLFVSRTAAVSYVIVSVLFLLNLLGQLPFIAFDKGLFSAFPNLRDAISAWNVAIFIILFVITLKATKTQKQ